MYPNREYIVASLILLLNYSFSVSQIKPQLKFISEEKIPKFNLKKNYTSKIQLQKDLDRIGKSLQEKGFLLCEMDSLVCSENTCTTKIKTGKKFNWKYLGSGNIDRSLLQSAHFNGKNFNGNALSPSEINGVLNNILNWCENHGYPFASIKLDSVTIIGNEVSAVMNLQKHQFIKIDSVINYGNSPIKKRFLLRYLSLSEGMPYDERLLKSSEGKLKQLPFINQRTSPIVKITDKNTRFILLLDKRNASQFDGILGLQPDNTGKAILTGDIKMKVVNGILKSGESFELNWRRLQYQTQDLKTAVFYPYLFGLPFGTDYQLKIYRRDSSFIDVKNTLGFQYLFSGLNSFRVYYSQRNTNLLSTNGLKYITVLPDYADIATYSYGAGIKYESFDYRFNPKTGYAIQFNASAGNRIIRKNANVNELVYKNIELKSNQYQAESEVTWFIPLMKRSTIKFSTNSGTIISNKIFKNELFRIGGLKSLRGFDEESIFASSYAIGTIEYRFIFEQNSNLYVFSDFAWYENQASTKLITDTPYSFGAGINFETKTGIFSLAYGLGNQFGNGFDVRTGKIHFGLISLF